MKLNVKYLSFGILIFIIEVFIALKVSNTFIRFYVGDVLVIIMIYAILKGLTNKPTKRLPIYIFVFAVIIEISQSLSLIHLLGLENNNIASIVFGSVFDVKDILCYGIGALILLEWERLLRKDISYL